MSETDTSKAFSAIYTDGAYAQQHPDWHLGDAPTKAADVIKGVRAVANALGGKKIVLADVGAGVGGVLEELMKMLGGQTPAVEIEPIAFEISEQASAEARRRFPGIDVRQKFLDRTDGPFDATMFVDVLEHVENPWELLRTAHAVSKYLIVRQPLLGNFSRFRHDNYRDQRLTWGHISLFNSRSFADMTTATGWKPLEIEVLAPWELAGHSGRAGVLSKMMLRMSRAMASFFVDGFYLVGAYERV
jgi:hypothetical protein